MSDKTLSAFAILAAGFISLATTAQADEVKITSVQVSEQIYMLKGKGGNIGLFIGRCSRPPMNG